MEPNIFCSYSDIEKLPNKVRALYKTHDVRIGAHSDLGRMLDLCSAVEALVAECDYDELVNVCRSQRVLRTIVDCSDEAGLKEPLKRIASSPLNLASVDPSPGKDALFELDFIQYVKYRGLEAKIAEPDVVIAMPFGQYLVACKTINSLKNVEKQLRRGYGQLEKLGNGCVALNFEPHVCFEEPLRASSFAYVKQCLNSRLKELYETYSSLFEQKLRDGRLDGIVLQISCVADIEESSLDLEIFTHTVYFSRSLLQSLGARNRFNCFRSVMQGALGE
ncbi:hypothetical protein P4544_06640 [Halomonas sp. LY9]